MTIAKLTEARSARPLQQYTSNGYSKGPGAPGIRHRVDMNRLTGAVPLSWFTGRKYKD